MGASWQARDVPPMTWLLPHGGQRLPHERHHRAVDAVVQEQGQAVRRLRQGRREAAALHEAAAEEGHRAPEAHRAGDHHDAGHQRAGERQHPVDAAPLVGLVHVHVDEQHGADGLQHRAEGQVLEGKGPWVHRRERARPGPLPAAEARRAARRPVDRRAAHSPDEGQHLVDAEGNRDGNGGVGQKPQRVIPCASRRPRLKNS
mmetsp:Transcript_116814/g.377026  ORF Transcript_116814/g.377026 Transcript_116814/m.377026 type:complete len:202 (+) Transcript_116814:211-816(+)